MNKSALGILMVALLCACPLKAQTSEVSGLVKDSSGASVSSAVIRIQNTETGAKSETKSNQEGFYVLPFLKAGIYEMTVEATGFRIINQTGVRITVGANERIDFNVEVGQPTETVTVTAETGTPESPAVATVVDRQFVENLPLNGRSFQSLVELTPGVVLTVTNVTESGQFSVNGQRANANYFTIDGVSANFGVNGSATLYESAGGALPAYSALGGTNNLASVDAVQEFRIQTSTYAPEFGRQPGAQFSVVTRSGSNDLHGTAFDYLRNDVLDANDYFANLNGLRRRPFVRTTSASRSAALPGWGSFTTDGTRHSFLSRTKAFGSFSPPSPPRPLFRPSRRAKARRVWLRRFSMPSPCPTAQCPRRTPVLPASLAVTRNPHGSMPPAFESITLSETGGGYSDDSTTRPRGLNSAPCLRLRIS
jgi:hypothetical protein